MKHTNSVGTGVLDGPKSRGEEIACNLVAACRLPLGRPFFLLFAKTKLPSIGFAVNGSFYRFFSYFAKMLMIR